MEKKKIALFASHNGSIFESLYSYISQSNHSIEIIISNNKDAKVLDMAKKYNINSLVINESLYDAPDEKIIETLQTLDCNLVILAGYMKKISSSITKQFTIINSHPALLPKYGGKGMYGRYVHEAVIKNKETKSGLTIHYVNENYDEGAIILQKEVSIDSDDTVDSLEQKIKNLEKSAYIEAINLV